MKKVLSFIMAFVMSVSIISVPVSAKSDRLGEYEHSKEKFTDFKYEHIDGDELKDKIKDIKELCNADSHKQEVEKLIGELEDIIPIYNDMVNYSEYMYLRNGDDPYWKEEKLTNNKDFQDAFNQYVEALRAVYYSPCKSVLYNWYDDEGIKNILDTRVPTPEEVECSMIHQQLVTEFYDVNPTIDYMGKTYDIYELLDAYNGGELSDFAVSLLYPTLLREIKAETAEIYFKMIQNDNKQAKLYGYDNYMDYAYKEVFKRKYTADDALNTCTEIREKLFDFRGRFDAYKSLFLEKMVKEGLSDGTLKNLGKYIGELAPEFEEAYKYMINSESCMIIPAGESASSFTAVLKHFGMPFICMTASSDKLSELHTLVHEFGHYDSFYWRDIKNSNSNNLDLEETYSQGMEMLFVKVYPQIFKEAGKSAEMKHVGTLLDSIYNGAMVAEIELTAYRGDYKDSAELTLALDEIQDKYFPGSVSSWFIIPHIYEYPGYYISYVTSAVSALEIYEVSKEDYDKAIDKYVELIKYNTEDYDTAISKAGLTNKWTTKKLDAFLDKIIELYVDTEAPVIEGVEEGGSYTGSMTVNVKDTAPVGMRLEFGEKIYEPKARTFMVGGANEPYVLMVSDGFGNMTTVNFSVDPYPFAVAALSSDKKNVLMWDAVTGAEIYKIYGASLGKKYKLLGTTENTVMRYEHKVKGEKTCKYYVEAYQTDEDGNEILLDRSMKCYVAGAANSLKTDTANVEIKGDEVFSAKKGEVIKLSVIRTLNEENETDIATGKIKALRYVSTDKSVARVSKNGTVTAIGEGKCFIYAVSENGIRDRVEIKVG